MQPKIYISSSHSKHGALFALYYFEAGRDIYGWHIEVRNLYFSAAFFMAENFYAPHKWHLYRSIEDDVYGPWMIDFPPTKDEIRCPVPEPTVHELEHAQSKFVEEWLFFKNDIGIEAELSTYQMLGLPVHQVNVKSKRLCRLMKNGASSMYMSVGIDPNIVQMLHKYWRLSEKIPAK